MQDIHADKIVIVDFGSQYTQLIARRVREAGVFSVLVLPHTVGAYLKTNAPKGIILSGGPDSVNQASPMEIDQAVFDAGCPVLGICYGMQSMAKQKGGVVERAAASEFGHAVVKNITPNALFDGLGDEFSVWMSHGDHVTRVPEGFTVIGSSDNAPIAAMANEAQGLYAVQFHPEVTHTQQGALIISRFVHDICGAASDWNTNNIIENIVRDVRSLVKEEPVLLGLSGGVDSSVVAALLHRAIGDKLTCIFVDHGYLRHGEAEEVMTTFVKEQGMKVIAVNAQPAFDAALAGESCPETKRKICGRVFIEVFEEEAKKLQGIKWLAQGTIYPDVIESAGTESGAKVIKSHHNVGGLPEGLSFKLVEPLRELFKDEVRAIGLALGLPATRVHRHPFPGPGLLVRILGAVDQEKARILRAADLVFINALRKHGWYDKVAQAFAVFLPVKSVGVVGDERRYAYVVALRAVETIDFMTARWAHLPYELLEEVSNTIMNTIPEVARVTYDISSKPPATIEWE